MGVAPLRVSLHTSCITSTHKAPSFQLRLRQQSAKNSICSVNCLWHINWKVAYSNLEHSHVKWFLLLMEIMEIMVQNLHIYVPSFAKCKATVESGEGPEDTDTVCPLLVCNFQLSFRRDDRANIQRSHLNDDRSYRGWTCDTCSTIYPSACSIRLMAGCQIFLNKSPFCLTWWI